VKKVRGWIGEQSFELAEGHGQIVERLAEAQVFVGALRAAVDKGYSLPDARTFAQKSLEVFRETQG
jgi:hypothetical protein